MYSAPKIHTYYWHPWYCLQGSTLAYSIECKIFNKDQKWVLCLWLLMDCSLDFLRCLGRLLGISLPSAEMECDHLALLGSLSSKEKEWESWSSVLSTSTYLVQVFFGVLRITQRMAYCLEFLIESLNSRIPLIHSPLILHKRNLCRNQDAVMLVKKLLSANQHWSAQGPDRLHWACSCSSGLVSDVQLLNQVLESCVCQCDWS